MHTLLSAFVWFDLLSYMVSNGILFICLDFLICLKLVHECSLLVQYMIEYSKNVILHSHNIIRSLDLYTKLSFHNWKRFTSCDFSRDNFIPNVHLFEYIDDISPFIFTLICLRRRLISAFFWVDDICFHTSKQDKSNYVNYMLCLPYLKLRQLVLDRVIVNALICYW
jgi:hypothetical protein